MSKIKFLMNVGTHFSATNPLWFSLSHDNKYVHTGHKKEMRFLLSLQDNIVTKVQINPNKIKVKMFPHLFSSHPNEYFTNTIEDYINYYKNHWEYIKDEYQSVGDFTNHYAGLTSKFIASIADKLNNAFDMKVTMIFRDPIRRLFSTVGTNKKFQDRLNGIEKKGKRQMWIDKGIKYAQYDRIYNNFASHFNTHVIIMEKLWKDHSSLSKFLNYDIKKLHYNVYTPDLGPDHPNEPPHLKDQWKSDKEHITQESMDMGKDKLGYVYENFEKTFGYIPEEWEMS